MVRTFPLRVVGESPSYRSSSPLKPRLVSNSTFRCGLDDDLELRFDDEWFFGFEDHMTSDLMNASVAKVTAKYADEVGSI